MEPVLTQRGDDTEPVFVERMKTFDAQTAPVVAHYRNQGASKRRNGDQGVETSTRDRASHRQAAPCFS